MAATRVRHHEEEIIPKRDKEAAESRPRKLQRQNGVRAQDLQEYFNRQESFSLKILKPKAGFLPRV